MIPARPQPPNGRSRLGARAGRRDGDLDVAHSAALFADPGRARILAALLDRRALPASVLAAEAGVSPSATSAHLAKLVDAGLITVEKSGRHRYHRLAGDQVATALEALAALAAPRPVRSLRGHTNAAALRHARSCYDHLAGSWGVALTAALLDTGALHATDGTHDTTRRETDPYSAPIPEHPYTLGPNAEPVLARLEVNLDDLLQQRSRRPLLRFCLDWSEQRHHLAGRLGTALLDSLRRHDWIRDGPRPRTLVITDHGQQHLTAALGLTPADITNRGGPPAN